MLREAPTRRAIEQPCPGLLIMIIEPNPIWVNERWKFHYDRLFGGSPERDLKGMEVRTPIIETRLIFHEFAIHVQSTKLISSVLISSLLLK